MNTCFDPIIRIILFRDINKAFVIQVSWWNNFLLRLRLLDVYFISFFLFFLIFSCRILIYCLSICASLFSMFVLCSSFYYSFSLSKIFTDIEGQDSLIIKSKHRTIGWYDTSYRHLIGIYTDPFFFLSFFFSSFLLYKWL